MPLCCSKELGVTQIVMNHNILCKHIAAWQRVNASHNFYSTQVRGLIALKLIRFVSTGCLRRGGTAVRREIWDQ